METPSDRRYTPAHEWVQIVSDDPEGTRVRIGISDFAQDSLGDIVFVDLPEVDRSVEAGETIAEVESTKSVGEVYAPMTGKVAAANAELEDTPELVNEDPYGRGWIAELVVADMAGFDGLLDAEAYAGTLD